MPVLDENWPDSIESLTPHLDFKRYMSWSFCVQWEVIYRFVDIGVIVTINI
jgi:hypothetical protein